jgi:hypothetical protein
LKPRRAITLCWTANTPSNATSIAIAAASGPLVGPSIARGTPKFPMNPIA